jgi:hypothetical protein
MMQTVYVWILILASWDGGVMKVENIHSWDDCERLRLRAEAVQTPNQRRMLSGTCTQVGLLVPATQLQPAPAPVINVQPSTAAVKNTVIIKRGAP